MSTNKGPLSPSPRPPTLLLEFLASISSFTLSSLSSSPPLCWRQRPSHSLSSLSRKIMPTLLSPQPPLLTTFLTALNIFILTLTALLTPLPLIPQPLKAPSLTLTLFIPPTSGSFSLTLLTLIIPLLTPPLFSSLLTMTSISPVTP